MKPTRIEWVLLVNDKVVRYSMSTALLTRKDSLLVNLRKRNSTAREANVGVGLEDAPRALRKLSVAGFVTQATNKSGPVMRNGQKVWSITPAGREYIKAQLKSR